MLFLTFLSVISYVYPIVSCVYPIVSWVYPIVSFVYPFVSCVHPIVSCMKFSFFSQVLCISGFPSCENRLSCGFGVSQDCKIISNEKVRYFLKAFLTGTRTPSVQIVQVDHEQPTVSYIESGKSLNTTRNQNNETMYMTDTRKTPQSAPTKTNNNQVCDCHNNNGDQNQLLLHIDPIQ
jgi:hypothetical protein